VRLLINDWFNDSRIRRLRCSAQGVASLAMTPMGALNPEECFFPLAMIPFHVIAGYKQSE